MRARLETHHVNSTLSSLRILESIKDDIQDIESGQRGYVISGNKEFLTPYQSGLQRLSKDTQQIKNLLLLYPDRKDILLQLAGLVERKAVHSIDVVNVMNRRNSDSAQQYIQSGKGKMLMDSIRQVIDKIEDIDRVVLKNSNAQRELAANATTRLFIGLAATLFLILGLLFWRINKSLIRRDEFERKISYLAIFRDTTADAIVTTDKEGIIVDWNKGAEKVFGYTREEAIGKVARTLTQTVSLNETMEQLRTNMLSREYYEFETSNKTKSGKSIACLSSATILKDNNGEITSVVTIARDITERKLAEQMLGKFNEALNKEVSEKTLLIKDILERVSDGFYSLNEHWEFTYINPTAARVLDKSPDELLGKNIWEIFPEAKNNPVYTTYFKTLETQVSSRIDAYSSKLNKWFHLDIYPASNGISVFFRDITENKLREEALKKSNDRFEMIAFATGESIWEWDLETNELWANAAHQELYGLTLADPVPSYEEWKNQLHPDDRQRMENRQADALASDNKIWISEYRFKTKNRGYIDVFDRCCIVRNEEGKAIRLLGSMLDVTERRKAEESIRNSEETRRLIMNSALDAIICIDVDGCITVWTSQAEKIFGWTEPEVVGKKLSEVIIPLSYRDKHESGMKKYRETRNGTILNRLIEIKAIKKSGEEFPVELSVTPIKQGEVEFFCSFIRDISERKRIEAQVIKEKELSDTVINSLPGVFYLFDIHRKLIRWNKNFETVLGYSSTEITSMPPVEFFVEEHRKLIQQQVESIFKNGMAETEASFLTKDGRSIPYYLTGLAINYEGVPCMLGTGINITERKKAEEELVKTNARFQIISKATSDIVWDWDLGKGELWWNDNYYSSLGYKKEKEIVFVHDWYENIHPEDMGRVQENVQAAINGKGHIWQYTYRYRDVKGNYFHFLDRGFILRDNEGKAYRMIGSMVNMTPIYQAQRELTESENRLRTILNTDPECIKLLGKDCEVVEINPSGLRLIEAPDLGSVKGKSLLPVVADKYKEAAGSLVREAFEGKEGRLEFEMVTLKGNYRWCDLSIVPFRNAEGKIINALGVTRDITDKRKAQLEIIRNEEKYRTLVEQAGDAIALYDEAGNVLDINTGAIQLLGYGKEELQHMNLSQILTNEEIQINPIDYNTLSKGESTIKQRKMKRKDGTIVETEVRSQQLPDGRFLSVIRDLTERMKAQHQIQKEKELSDSIINTLPGIFYFFDYSGKFIRWNDRFEKVTGYSAQEIAKMQPFDFFAEEDKPLLEEKKAEVLAKGTSDVESYLFTKSGEKIPYFFTVAHIVNDGVSCILGTGVDITDRKKAEDKLNKSYTEIRKLTGHIQAVREEERTHIAREIHDELGQQLTVLKMDVSWLNKKLKVPDEDPVKIKVKDLLGMLDSTVKTVRRISSDLRPSLLDDLGLVAAMEWQLAEFSKRFDITTNLSTSIEDVKLPDDIKTGIFRILQESLTNVARHAKATNVMVSFEKLMENFVLSIADNGTGFDKQILENKKTLGILGMKERSAMIGGNYDIISSSGKGTTVILTVPVRYLN